MFHSSHQLLILLADRENPIRTQRRTIKTVSKLFAQMKKCLAKTSHPWMTCHRQLHYESFYNDRNTVRSRSIGDMLLVKSYLVFVQCGNFILSPKTRFFFLLNKITDKTDQVRNHICRLSLLTRMDQIHWPVN